MFKRTMRFTKHCGCCAGITYRGRHRFSKVWKTKSHFSFFFCCCDKILRKKKKPKQIERERAYFSSQFMVTVHHGGENQDTRSLKQLATMYPTWEPQRHEWMLLNSLSLFRTPLGNGATQSGQVFSLWSNQWAREVAPSLRTLAALLDDVNFSTYIRQLTSSSNT